LAPGLASPAPRSILLNPGPVTLSERVRTALTAGDWCHREPEFAALVREINSELAAVHPELSGDYDAVLLTGSGTAAVEATLATFAPDRRRTLVLANGVYGERMARMLASHGKPHRVLAHDWTAPLDLPALERALSEDAAISHVAVVHHETTTGRLNDLEAVARICQAWGASLLVDAVSSFGAEAIAGRDWNLAAVAGTANKCLHGAPGLSFVLARRELWAGAAQPGSVYFDLRAYHRGQHGDGFSPFTQAVQIAFALREALAEHREHGGWLARRALFRARAELIHQTLARCGITTLLESSEYGSVLWSYRLPAGLGYARLHDGLKRRGFVIYAGQGQLAPEVFRIAHMGDIGADDLERLCAALPAIIGARR
jgi:2-aminoethylphosphonate-pyruvate transaminase